MTTPTLRPAGLSPKARYDHLIKGNQVRWSNRDGANNPFWNVGNCSSVQVCDDNDRHAVLDDALLPENLF
jgi:hypothetical protein